MLRKLMIKWKVWRGKAIDIWSKSAYPANVLSNLYANAFEFDGVQCGSMEGFLQSLKYADEDEQRLVCALAGKEAKNKTTEEWKVSQMLYWKGRPITRESKEFQAIVKQAYAELFWQNETFRNALLSTTGKCLYHANGNPNPKDTILTEKEFCDSLEELRDKI